MALAASLAVAGSVSIASCGSATPSATSPAAGTPAAPSSPAAPSTGPTSSSGGTIGSPSPTSASGWSLATVEQPSAVGAAASGAAPGLFCSPCHSTVTTYMDALVAGGPGLVAVGLAFPGTYAAAWTSADGLTWQRTPDLGPAGTRAFAVAHGPGGFAAVGDSGHVAAAWWSADGRIWGVGDLPPIGNMSSSQMLAVTARPGGYVAGGWLQGPDGRSRAALWTTGDGRSWALQPAPPGAAGAQVHGLAADASAVVAVGVGSAAGAGAPGAGASGMAAEGSDQAVAWVSTDGRTWRAATVEGAPGARMEAVIATPAGWLAVGSRDGALSAASWTSTDGLTWHIAGESAALRDLGGTIRMLGVAATGAGYVAAGWRDSVGNGNAVAWTSPDGIAWTRMADDASFSGGGMAAVAGYRGQVVAVGTVGWPDDHFATVWVHAAAR